MAIKENSQLNSFTMRSNTIDLSLSPINGDNPGCLVERKFVDLFLKQIVNIPFNVAKEAILAHLQDAKTFAEMEELFNESVYIHRVCEKLHEVEAEKQGPRVIGKIQLD